MFTFKKGPTSTITSLIISGIIKLKVISQYKKNFSTTFSNETTEKFPVTETLHTNLYLLGFT